MADFDNLFDAAIARADETIRGYMGTSATMTSGEQSGAVIRGVFDDPENISYAGQGVRVEGSSPSLFVRTDDVRQLRRGDTLTIGEENFWIDRVSPDDGGSCYLWLNRGQPPGFLFSMAEMCFMLFGRRISDFCTEWQVAVNLFRGRLYGKRGR